MKLRLLRPRLGVPILLVLLVVLAFVLTHPHTAGDWFRLYGYTPSSAVRQLVSVTGMTGKAEHLFYINRPELLDKSQFRQRCPRYDEQTIVIGCFLSGQRGIYVLSVEDERLEGVEEVTAAHEMLHAAYERLDRGERATIDKLLQQYADNGLQNERIVEALEGYRKSEPGQELNEMHSMFGTEIASLPAELEEYYAQYFTSRQTVVKAAERYQAAFTSRQTSIKQYDEQLESLSVQIKTNTQSLERQGAIIDQERNLLDAHRQSGNIDAYNAGVEPFNAKVNAYNGLLATTREMIERYNKLVSERNAIAAQTVELQQAIDSSSLPQSQ